MSVRPSEQSAELPDVTAADAAAGRLAEPDIAPLPFELPIRPAAEAPPAAAEPTTRAATTRALVLAPQPFFSGRGTPFSVYFRTRALAEQGVAVDLLTYGEGDDVELPGVRVIRIPRIPFCRDVKVGPSPAKLVLDVVMLLWTVVLLWRNRYSFVHAHEEAVFWAMWLKPLFGYRLVYDMHSSLAQQLGNFGYVSGGPVVRAFERLERRALARADAVITICPDLEKFAVAAMPDPSRHILIENSVFGEIRLRARRATRYPRLGAEALRMPVGKRVLLYAGTFERYQGLELLVRAWASARSECADAVLVLVGGAPQQVLALQRLARQLGLGEADTRIIGRIAPDQVRDLIGMASVLLSPRIDGTNTPLKIYEQLASGIPLVATRIYSHTQVLNDDVCFMVEPDERSLAAGLVAALTDEDRRHRVTAAAAALYEVKYSPAAYEEKMRRLLETIG